MDFIDRRKLAGSHPDPWLEYEPGMDELELSFYMTQEEYEEMCNERDGTTDCGDLDEE